MISLVGACNGGAAAVTANDVGRTGEGGSQVLWRTTVEVHGVSLPPFAIARAVPTTVRRNSLGL